MRAKANEAAKQAEVTKIQGLIQGLADDVAAKRAIADQRSDEFYVAQQAYFDAAYRADQLQKQADAEAAKAVDAANKAGRVAAQLYRNGGDDTSLELFFSGSAANADDLLARLGTMDKLVERNRDVYSEAITARDSAQSLSDQAVVARTERDRLQQAAEAKMVAAQQAADAAQAALDEQQQRQTELERAARRAPGHHRQTIAQYQEGERVRKAAAGQGQG